MHLSLSLSLLIDPNCTVNRSLCDFLSVNVIYSLVFLVYLCNDYDDSAYFFVELGFDINKRPVKQSLLDFEKLSINGSANVADLLPLLLRIPFSIVSLKREGDNYIYSTGVDIIVYAKALSHAYPQKVSYGYAYLDDDNVVSRRSDPKLRPSGKHWVTVIFAKAIKGTC
ncbi:hypothetical protein QVD17_19485 [Tagetes erecta]|uniref:Uncharacterized protein n=1 Tax=Tagetes erecta TaxID=13708 RepID=A0AAD8KN44_TARER|nr:hypothetical protein QVD17_19485 [Tagetes erecta]